MAADQRCQRRTDARVIDNAFLGNTDGGDADNMRLDFAHSGRLKQLESRESVSLPTLEQVVEPGKLVRSHGHHQLSADLMRDFVAAAELHHLSDTAYRQTGLSGTGFVVQARMQHAAVVAGLVPSHGGLLFKKRNAGRGLTLPHARPGCDADAP